MSLAASMRNRLVRTGAEARVYIQRGWVPLTSRQSQTVLFFTSQKSEFFMRNIHMVEQNLNTKSKQVYLGFFGSGTGRA